MIIMLWFFLYWCINSTTCMDLMYTYGLVRYDWILQAIYFFLYCMSLVHTRIRLLCMMNRCKIKEENIKSHLQNHNSSSCYHWFHLFHLHRLTRYAKKHLLKCQNACNNHIKNCQIPLQVVKFYLRIVWNKIIQSKSIMSNNKVDTMVRLPFVNLSRATSDIRRNLQDD